MKTVTHEGKVYQIGGLYEFSDNGHKVYIDTLADINNSDNPFVDREGFGWKLLREIQNPIMGTIKDAPIELEDGCVYQFDFGGERGFAGQFIGAGDFHLFNGVTIEVKGCTNIVKLVPEVK